MENEEQLMQMQHRFEEIETRLNAPETLSDSAKLTQLMKEYKRLQPIAEAYGEYRVLLRSIAHTEAFLHEPDSDEEMLALARDEIQEMQEKAAAAERTIRELLLPAQSQADSDVIVEIRSGAGGEEAALFAHSLHRMYSMYADRQGWTQQILSLNETERGGVKEIIFTLSGENVYSRMKFESGVHRVQRVPETESQGRIHTSTATVAVLQQVADVEFELNPDDLRIDTFRSSGAGGQHINKTSSAIRVTHIPTGTVVECQNERSQLQNKERALDVLRARLHAKAQAEQDAQVAAERRTQVGTGDRSEKIRTYNFPQSRLTDHRIGLSIYKLNDVMNGNLDDVFRALISAENADRLTGSNQEDSHENPAPQ